MSRDVLGSPLDLKLLIDSVSQMSVTRQNVEQTVSVASNGELVSEMLAQGDLTVRAVMEAGLGDPVLARIREHSRTGMADQQDFVSSNRHQRIIPNGGPVEQLHESLRVGPNALTRYRSDERCGP